MKQFSYIILISILFFSCAIPPNIIRIEKESIESETLKNQLDHFIKRKVAIGRFSNETSYGKGFFETYEETLTSTMYCQKCHPLECSRLRVYQERGNVFYS